MKIVILLIFMLSIPFILTCGDLIQEEPGTTKEIEISNIQTTPSADSAVISFKTDVATRHMIKYGTASNFYTASTNLSTTDETAHSLAIGNLNPETTYYFSIKVYNPSYGESSSDEQTFITTISPTNEERLRGIWIVGGLSGNSIGTTVPDVDLYDPETKIWYRGVTFLPVPVSFASYTMTHGILYVIGGFDSTGAVSTTVQIYNVSTNEWSISLAPGFAGAANIGSFIYGENIYILGGTTGNASDGWAGSMTTQVYNIPEDSWSAMVNTSTANSSERYGAAFNGVLYFMGGRSSAAYPIYTNDGISIVNNARTTTTEVILPSRRTGQSTVIYQPSDSTAKIIIVGGFTVLTNITGNFIFQYSVTPATTSVNTCYYLDYPFTQGSWKLFTNSYPIPHGFSASVINEKMLYVFGGVATYNSGGLSASYVIDLSALPGNSWNVLMNMPSARYGHGAVMNQ